MKWSIKFATVAGIELKIHLTFVIFLAWVAFTYYASGGQQAAISGTLFVVLLFACVVLHELGHALAARHYGIRTPDITLLPIGGVARLERIPEDPRQELVIAVAGPLVNVVIAAVLFLVLHRSAGAVIRTAGTAGGSIPDKLALVNVMLVLFNLIPAFPMDGGRVLRALLAMRMRYARATHIAAKVGQALAMVFGIAGLFLNPFLVFIAVFVYLGAGQEAALAQLKDVSIGVPVSEAMVTDLRKLPASARVDDTAHTALRSAQREFPVMDEEDHVLGVLTRGDIIKALRHGHGGEPVSEFMHCTKATVGPEATLDDAFSKMQQSGCPALPVIDHSGHLVGILTPEHVGEMMTIRSLDGGKSSWRPAA